jgi:hypothetical protein
MQHILFIMHVRWLAASTIRVPLWKKLRENSASYWSLLGKYITMHCPQNVKFHRTYFCLTMSYPVWSSIGHYYIHKRRGVLLCNPALCTMPIARSYNACYTLTHSVLKSKNLGNFNNNITNPVPWCRTPSSRPMLPNSSTNASVTLEEMVV